jgi:hypothetical protein
MPATGELPDASVGAWGCSSSHLAEARWLIVAPSLRPKGVSTGVGKAILACVGSKVSCARTRPCKTGPMPPKDARGTYIIRIPYDQVTRSVSAVIQSLGPDAVAKLKISSGEHLAAVLATAFLGVAPSGVDEDGNAPDLRFDLSHASMSNSYLVDMVGQPSAGVADFEVKSLSGTYRPFEASIDRKVAEGGRAGQIGFHVKIISANGVPNGADGQRRIKAAWAQLLKKSSPEHSRNIFLISHFLDYPFAEYGDAPFIAHHLNLPEVPDGLDSLWVLFAPSCLVLWSASTQRWTNLIFQAYWPGEDAPGGDDEDLDLLQQVDMEFLNQAGTPKMSPYVYGFGLERPPAASPNE